MIVFVVQNTDDVTVSWTVWETDAPLAAIVLGGILLGAVLGAVWGLLWRWRRRRALGQKEELGRLRASQGSPSEPPQTPPPAGEPEN